MRIPDEVRKCVVYLGTEVVSGATKKIRYGGTGFFIALRSKVVGIGGFLSLVTAKM